MIKKATIAICAIAALRASGEWLDDGTVADAANRWLEQNSVAQLTMRGLSVDSIAKRGALRIAILSPAGYIVFSGSDLSGPVISFSANEYLEPEEGSAFCDMLAFSDANVAKREAEGGERADRWVRLIGRRDGSWPAQMRLLGANSADVPDSAIIIAPFMSLHWNQWQPWNDFCPKHDSDDGGVYRGRCPCGCVATATAQQIAHFKWPWRTGRQDTWNHTLDTDGKPDVPDGPYADTNVVVRFDGHNPFAWDAMLDAYEDYWDDVRGRKTESERFAVARFMSWVDLITKMNFGKDGSGANFWNTKDTSTDWYEAWELYDLEKENQEAIEKIKSDLELGVPVHVGVPGHSVIGHGLAYDNNSGTYYLYLNYGWGGSNDGWFELFTETSSVGGAFPGFRPKKMAQLETLPKVCDGEVEVKWHVPDFHKDAITGFDVRAYSYTDVQDETCDFSGEGVVSSDPDKLYVTNQAADTGNGNDFLIISAWCSGNCELPGERKLTGSSILSYRVLSSDVGDERKVEIQASFEGGDWQTVSVPLLNRGMYSTSWVEHKIFLGNHAGETVRFRITCDWGGGSVCFDDFSCSDVLLPIAIQSKRTVADARSCVLGGFESGMEIGVSVTPVFADGYGLESDVERTRISGTARLPAAMEITERKTIDLVYAKGDAAWSISSSAVGDTTILCDGWSGGFGLALPGRITANSKLEFSWTVHGYYGDSDEWYDCISAIFEDDSGEETVFWSTTNRQVRVNRQFVTLSLYDFRGKSGSVRIKFGHNNSNYTGEDDRMRFYAPKIYNISVPVVPQGEWKSRTYAVCDEPQIHSVRGCDGMELDEEFYRELKMGEFDTLRVKCSESVTDLKAYPSHLTYMGDDDVMVEKGASGEFLVKMNTSKAPRRQRMMLTLEASNSNGDAVYRDLSLRFDEPKAVAQLDRWRKITTLADDRPVAAYTFDNFDTSNSGTGDFGLYVSSENVTYEDSPLGRSINNKASDGPWGNWNLNMSNEWTVLMIAKTSDVKNGVVFAVGTTSRCGFALLDGDENTVKLAHWTNWTKRGEITANVPGATKKFHAYAIRGNGVNAELHVDGLKAAEFTMIGIPDFGFKMFGVYGGANYVGLVNGAGEAVDDFRMYCTALPDAAIAAYAATLFGFDESPAGVAVEDGGTVVPECWFAKYRPGKTLSREQLLAKAANGRSVWECYVAGLDPTDENDDLVADIAFEDGVPKVSIANGAKTNRKYRIWGRKSLNPDETPVDVTNVEDLSAEGCKDLRFFHITAELP